MCTFYQYRKLHKYFVLLLLQILVLHFSSGQNSMTLQECIEYAFKNSLTVKQTANNLEASKLTDKLNRQARFPNVSGSSFGALQLGRTIDPTTNSFDTRDIWSQSFSLNFSVPVFNGGRINNNIKKGKLSIQSSEAEADFTFNNIALSIATTYLQILMVQEQLENSYKRRNLSQQQLEQTDKLIAAGTLPSNDRLDVLAQIARDEQTIVTAQNQLDISYLNLKELMQIDPNVDIKVVKPVFVIPVDENPDNYSFQETYVSALGTQPQIRRDELQLQNAHLDVEIANSAMLPSLFLFAGLDTRWSSLAKTANFVTQRQSQVFYINNQAVNVGFDVNVPSTYNNIPYFDQIDQNFGQSLGLNMSIPIYNNGINRINKDRAKVAVQMAGLQSEFTKQQLKADVQQAIASARAAKRTLDASQKTADAARASFENAEKRFGLGAINSLQLTIARNTLDIANTELTSARYDYLFRLKIIDFYLGKPLKLD